MKDKAFIIDFNLLAEQNLSIDEFINLIYLNNDKPVDSKILSLLQEKQFIKLTDNHEIVIREKGKLLLELTLIDSINSVKNKKITKKSSRLINQELESFIKEYRNLWKGLKPGSMGSEQGVKDKLFRWMQNNPEYSKDDILNAAKMYINSLTSYVYLQQADYFIYKKDLNGESSRLSAFIDEKEPEKDWTSNLI